MPRPGRFAVGLTGGIGSGKSTVAELFAARGAAMIDTDQLAHSLTAPGGAAMAAIQAAFGAQAVAADGAMDRAWMRARVFADAAEKQRLEAILHPLIRVETERAAAAAGGDYLLYVVPLLVESGSWRAKVDRILVVDCPEDLQVERVMRRSGLKEEQVRSIMAAQVTREARLAAADDVIANDGDTDSLPAKVDALHERYRFLSLQREKDG